MAKRTLGGAAATRRKKQRKKPATRAELKRSRRRYCEEDAPALAPCDLERSSFDKRGGDYGILKSKILKDGIFPSQATRGRNKGCTFYVTKDEDIGEGLPTYTGNVSRGLSPGEQRGPYTVWSLCQGGRRVTGDYGHTTKKAAIETAKRSARWRGWKKR